MGKTRPIISVLNLTNRQGGIDILWANMKRQSITDWELIIVDGKWKEREKEVKDYINDSRLKYIRQSDKREGAYTNLAHADNEGFRACEGELIVLLQDFIWCPPFALHKFWEAHQSLKGNALISGVGHQYDNPGKDFISDPNGKITVFKEPFEGRPEHQVWNDPRMRTDQGTFYETSPVNWEANYAAIPRHVIYELGGMDEEYDFNGFAYDNVNIAQRAEMLGYKTYLDQTNECRAIEHDSWAADPSKKPRSNEIAAFHIKRMQDTVEGKFPLKLNYLKEVV